MPSLKPLNCKSTLMGMLRKQSVPKSDKRAIRFALHVMDNSWYRPKAIAHKDFPFWRMVRYTDDGCSIYQCLNCKKDWEGRSAPGWMDFTEEVDEADSTNSYMFQGKMVYYRDRKRPVYNADWKYCPHCNIEWHGPIREDRDNERMLGPRRKRIQDVIHARTDMKWY